MSAFSWQQQQQKARAQCHTLFSLPLLLAESIDTVGSLMTNVTRTNDLLRQTKQQGAEIFNWTSSLGSRSCIDLRLGLFGMGNRERVSRREDWQQKKMRFRMMLITLLIVENVKKRWQSLDANSLVWWVTCLSKAWSWSNYSFGIWTILLLLSSGQLESNRIPSSRLH